MRSHTRFLLAGIALLGVLGVSTPALADSIGPPRSYKQVAPGAKYVFVKVSPLSVEEEMQHWNEETKAGIREIRQTYTQTGMYRNDGSSEPLWTMTYPYGGVDLASDGVHLICFGPWAGLRADKTRNLDVDAVTFIANGREIRTYSIGELIDDPGSLPRSVSHFRWLKEGRVSGEFEYTLTTLDENRFVFDLRTGEILSESRAGRGYWWGRWAVCGAVVVAVVGFFWWRRSRAKRRLQKILAA